MSVYVYPTGGAAAVASYENKFGGGVEPTPVPDVGDSAQGGNFDLIVSYGDQVIAVIDGIHETYPDDFTLEKRITLVQAVHDGLQ
jgi:hypothetical protein